MDTEGGVCIIRRIFLLFLYRRRFITALPISITVVRVHRHVLCASDGFGLLESKGQDPRASFFLRTDARLVN